ncbi:MAG: hypothetical protein ABIQ30_09745 [Devosia sp.]
MRVAALAFGLLAGLIASLILALGGLDVSAGAVPPDRQMQAFRFGLFVIGNFGFLGAGLALAAPLAGAILLLLGAIAWVGAALFLHHTTDFVLITPPALLLIAATLAAVAFFRRARPEVADNELEILPPLGSRSSRAAAQESEEPPGMTIPAFAAEAQPSRGTPFRAASEEPVRTAAPEEWAPRKRKPPPPRATPAFRDVDEEYEEDDEPSGFSRFALATSSILSFGLYAALAGAALLVMWNARNMDTGRPAASAATAEIAAPSSAARVAAVPSSSEPELAPILRASSEPAAATQPTAPSLSALPETSVAALPSSEESFGGVLVPADPGAPPRLSEDTGLPFDGTAVSAPEPTAAPPVLPSEVVAADVSAEPLVAQGIATGGTVLPFTMTSEMAALRAGGRTPTRAAPPQPANNNTGL